MTEPNYKLTFLEYFARVNGTGININQFDRSLTIFDEHNLIISRVYFASTIKHSITLSELIAPKNEINHKDYCIVENGIDNKNWLYYRTFAGII